MSCCGSRRAAANLGTGLRSVPASAGATGGARRDTVALSYRGPVPMVLPSASGAAPYQLRDAGQRVDAPAADAAVLLATGWFSRA